MVFVMVNLLNSCLPDLKLPWEAVEVTDWSVQPPVEIMAFKPGVVFVSDGYYFVSKEFYYD